MQTEDGDDEGLSQIAGRYGPLPTIVGALFAAGLIWFMFTLADGFA